jgi:hypothetical protein
MLMRLRQAQYFNESAFGGPGRVPAGAVLDVDEAVAARWAALGVARKASKSARTFQEERLDRMAEEREERGLAPFEADRDEDDEDVDEAPRGVFGAHVDRGESPPPAAFPSAAPAHDGGKKK